MATGRPASALLQQRRVILAADEDGTARATRLYLRMALEAEILITLHEQFAVHRTVRLMTNHATLAHRLVFERNWARLLAMTGGASLVHTSYGRSTFRLEDVATMRVVALHTVHPVLEDGMVLGQFELGVRGQVTFQTGGGVFAGIDDELPRPAAGNVQAAGAVTGFATALPHHRTRGLKVNPRVRTRGKRAHIVGVTIHARAVTDIICTGNFQRIRQGAWHGGARIENQNPADTGECDERRGKSSCHQQGHIRMAGMGMGWELEPWRK